MNIRTVPFEVVFENLGWPWQQCQQTMDESFSPTLGLEATNFISCFPFLKTTSVERGRGIYHQVFPNVPAWSLCRGPLSAARSSSYRLNYMRRTTLSPVISQLGGTENLGTSQTTDVARGRI